MDRSARVRWCRATLVAAALLLGRETIWADTTDASYSQTQVTGLYRLVARLNGEPLPTAIDDPYPRAGAPDADSKPVICFPRGVGRFTRSAWKATPSLFASAEDALDALAAELKQARAASTFGKSAPTITLRLIGFADPTTGSAGSEASKTDDNNFGLSLDRAVAIRDALRKRLPKSGFALEAEGRGHYYPRPTDPHPADATERSIVENGLEVTNDADDRSCAPFQAAHKAVAKALQSPLALADFPEPGSRRYVAAQRRVEIEVVTAVMTHVGHRLTREAAPHPEKNDGRLRLYPDGTMPARVFTHELAFLPLAPQMAQPPHACAAFAGEGSLKLWRPVSSNWQRQTAINEADLPTSKLDGGDTLALRLDIDEVWKREGAKTQKGWRVSVLMANRAGFDADAAPLSYDRGLGMPGYWAVHQRFAALMKIALTGSAVAKCIDELAAAKGSALKKVLADLEALRDEVLAHLPKDIEGILLHVHRLDRRFRFFDLAAGMVLRSSPTDYDMLAGWMRPIDPTPIFLRADPIDPCGPVPVPRAAGAGDPKRVLTSDPFVGLFGGGYGITCTNPPYAGEVIEKRICTVTGGAGDANCTKQYRPITSVGDLNRFLAGGSVRVFAPLGDGTVPPYSGAPMAKLSCPRSSAPCAEDGWLFKQDSDGVSDNALYVTILARTSPNEPLDDGRSARANALPKPPTIAPCVGDVECGYLAGGISLTPMISVTLNGREEAASLGTRVVHLLPRDSLAACFDAKPSADKIGWSRNARLATALDVELAGPTDRPLVETRSLIVDRRDCRLLGIALTHGSHVTWSP